MKTILSLTLTLLSLSTMANVTCVAPIDTNEVRKIQGRIKSSSLGLNELCEETSININSYVRIFECTTQEACNQLKQEPCLAGDADFASVVDKVIEEQESSESRLTLDNYKYSNYLDIKGLFQQEFFIEDEALCSSIKEAVAQKSSAQ